MKNTVTRCRTTKQERDKFYEACKKRGETPSEVLRRMMAEYTHLKTTGK